MEFQNLVTIILVGCEKGMCADWNAEPSKEVKLSKSSSWAFCCGFCSCQG